MPSEPWIIHEYRKPRLGIGCERCGRMPDNLAFHYPIAPTPAKDVNKILEGCVLKEDDDHIIKGEG